jgi:hypothetical protein
MGWKWVVRTVVGGLAALALLGLVTMGCGILTAPVSVPAALLANDSPGLAGTIVDEAGRPVSGVHIHVSTTRVTWDPMFLQNSTSKESDVVADGTFDIKPERGSSMGLTFARAGYRKRMVEVTADKMYQSGEGLPTRGTWRREKRVEVVLERADARFPALARASEAVAYPGSGGVMGIDLEHPGALYVGPSVIPHLFYATVEGLEHFSAGAVVDPPDRNLPKRMRFRISDADGGFVRYMPHFGRDVLAQMTEAPAEGYVRELVLTRGELDKMRAIEAKETDEVELFYFRAGGRFGKGLITWDRRYQDEGSLQLRYVLLYQRTAGDRDLRSSETTSQ